MSKYNVGYIIGAEFDSRCDDNSLFDIFMLDERVSFGEVVLYDEILLISERKINGLYLLEMGGLHLLRLPRLHVHTIHINDIYGYRR